MIIRGEVYAWDNTLQHATGQALYESGQVQTTDSTSFQTITFNTGGIPVTANAQYVVFITVSRDYALNAGTGNGIVGSTGAQDTYTGGDFVSIQDNGDPSQWTTTAWTSYPGYADDLAFTATFSLNKNPPSGP
jgi:hypothetical protein